MKSLKGLISCKFFILLTALIILMGMTSYCGNAQSMGISSGSITPDASSILELRTTTKGLLIPRMTTTERDAISLPATGLMVYNTTTSKFNFYDGSSWIANSTGSAGVNSITGTTNRITIGGTAADPTVDISSSYVGQTSITTLGTIGTGTWNATTISDGKIASALTGKTYNDLTLSAQVTGFTIAGGTTSKTLTVPLDATVSGTNTGDQTTVSGNAGSATLTAITDDNATAATMYPTWVTTASGNQAQKVSSTKLSFNPSTGTLTSVAFAGSLTGNVTGNVTGSSGSTTGNAATVTTNANLTGDVTSVGNATSIAANAVITADILNANVTYAKIQNVSATNMILGRVTAGAGVVEEIPTTGSGNVVRATSPTLVTPVLGVATGTSLALGGGTALTTTNQTGTGSLVMAISPTLTGTPTLPTGTIATTQAGGNNTTAIATTAFVAAAVSNASYKTILQVSGSHIAAKVAGKYALGNSNPIAISGTGTLYPIATIFINSADYPTVNGAAPDLRIRAQLYVNDVAPTGNYTFGLYPITRPATSGGAGLNIYTLGTVVTGSNGATFTAPAADGLLSAVGADFALPANGHYVIGVVTTATVAASSHLHMTASLQFRNN